MKSKQPSTRENYAFYLGGLKTMAPFIPLSADLTLRRGAGQRPATARPLLARLRDRIRARRSG